jgi:hypothetical protein
MVPEEVPRAHHVELGRCKDPTCDAVHFILCDENDVPIAVCALRPDQVERALAYMPGPPKCPETGRGDC